MTEQKDIKPCECCGQDRPHPTEPDEIWEFISLAELSYYGSEAVWTQVRTVREYEYEEPVLCIEPANPEKYFARIIDEDGELPRDLRIWWPSNVIWRKIGNA